LTTKSGEEPASPEYALLDEKEILSFKAYIIAIYALKDKDNIIIIIPGQNQPST